MYAKIPVVQTADYSVQALAISMISLVGVVKYISVQEANELASFIRLERFLAIEQKNC